MSNPLTTSTEPEHDIKEIIECLKAIEGVKKKLLGIVLKEKKNGT